MSYSRYTPEWWAERIHLIQAFVEGKDIYLGDTHFTRPEFLHSAGRYRIVEPDPNRDSQMPQAWRDMLDRHPMRREYPHAVIQNGGAVCMCGDKPSPREGAWLGAVAFNTGCIPDMTGIDWTKTYYLIPSGDES